jgi:hypothetical protein
LAPVGAKNVFYLTVQVRIVVAGAGGSAQTVGVRRLIGMSSAFLFRIQSDIGTQSDQIVFYVFAFQAYIFTVITMDTDTLISKVFLRPATWDKRLKVYTKWAVVGNCWQEISGEMEVPGK